MSDNRTTIRRAVKIAAELWGMNPDIILARQKAWGSLKLRSAVYVALKKAGIPKDDILRVIAPTYKPEELYKYHNKRWNDPENGMVYRSRFVELQRQINS